MQQGPQIDYSTLTAAFLEKHNREEIKQTVAERLKAEMFIDSKNKKPTDFQFRPCFITSGLFTQQEAIQYIEQAERLLRRSDNNLGTLTQLLEAYSQTDVDLSSHIESLQETLKTLLNTNTQAIACLNCALGQVKQVAVLQQTAAFVERGLQSTNDEAKKLQYVGLITGLARALKFLPADADKALAQDAALRVLIKGIEAVTTDEQFLLVAPILSLLSKNGSRTYVIPESSVASLKKLAGQNRFCASFVNLFALHHIKLRKQEAQEEKAIFDIAESILQQSVVNNLKHFGKTISQPIMFFSGLEFILMYLHYCQEAPAKQVTVIHKELQEKLAVIFNNKSHFSQLKYLVQTSVPESSLIGESLLLLYATYQEDYADQSVEFKFEYFSNLLNLIAFSGKTKNHFSIDGIVPILTEILDKKDNGWAQFFIDVFFTLRWYLFTINPYRHIDLTFRKDRLNEFLRVLVNLLVKQIEADHEYLSNIPDLDDIILPLAHAFASPSWLAHLLHILRKHGLAEQTLIQLLATKSAQPHYWISMYGFESQNRHTFASMTRYCTFIVNLGARVQMISSLLPVLDVSNLSDTSSLDVVNEEAKTFITGFQGNNDPGIDGILTAMGVIVYSNVPPEDEEEEAMRLLIAKQQRGKRGESLQMMDEQEAAEQVVRQHKTRFINYFTSMCKYLSCFHLTDSIDAREWFFSNYYDKLTELCQHEGNRLPYIRLVLPFLRKTRLTEPYAQAIVDFNIQKSIGQASLTQTTLNRLLKFQQTLENTKEITSVSTLYLVNQLQQYVLIKNDFELRNKQLAMRFALNYSTVSTYFAQNLLNPYYDVIVKNINICAHVKEAFDLINLILANNENKSEHYLKIFDDILNLVEEAKILALNCLKLVPPSTLPIEFGFALKLRVLKLSGTDNVTGLAEQLISTLPPIEQYLHTLPKFDFQDFANRNAREHLEYATQVFIETFHEEVHWSLITSKAIEAGRQLEPKIALGEEQLLFFPYFVNVCVTHIPESLTADIIDVLIGHFARLESRQHLVQQSIEAGVSVIKRFGATNHAQILPVIEKYLKSNAKPVAKPAQVQQKKGAAKPKPVHQTTSQFDQEANLASTSSSICAVILLGVLSPNLSSSKEQLLSIQQQILQLLKTSPRSTQVNLAKCLGDLLAFFPDAVLMIKETLQRNKQETNIDTKRGNAFLVAGLLRGMGVQILEELRIIETIDEQSGGKKEAIEEKEANLFQLEALVEIFGRLAEPYYVPILSILMKYFGDNKEEIRQISINATKIIMQRLTGYGVKIILPHLFQGIEDSKSWRGKIANIWALGNMAYCSPKQLAANLPLIVSSISRAISDTHPEVRKSANESLELIGSTIQNPEISEIASYLIKSLSNPFDENLKGLDIILSTNFGHYIDAPALSLLIPIIDYGLRSQESMQKQQAARVVGSIPALIKHSQDLVPYMDMIVGGLEVALGDPLIEVRALAAKAIGQLGTKIGIENTERFFGFVWRLLESQDLASIKRSGAANSLAEIACSQDQDYFELQLQRIFEMTQSREVYIKEGYVGTFIYMPGIMNERFEPYVKDVIDNIQELVSSDDDTVRSISLRVLKILIQNYAVPQNELLYPTLREAMKNEYWKRRNAAVILSGEMLEITQSIVSKQLEHPMNPQYVNIELYVQNLMLLYILRCDDAEQVRMNATQIWKSYIDNTPRWVKRGLRHLIRLLADMMTRPGLPTIGVSAIQNFCQKYGESHLSEVLNHLDVILTEETDLTMITGAYMVMTQLYRYSGYDILVRFSSKLQTLSQAYILSTEHSIKKQLFQSVGMMITKLKSTQFVEDLIEPYLTALAGMTEEDPHYQVHLEIFDELCSLNSQLILQYLVVLILAPPLDQYKIDILTNNARTFAQVMYTQTNGVLPMSVLFSELYSNTGEYTIEHDGAMNWPNRTQSLIYCIGQLSINMRKDTIDLVSEFLRNILSQFEQFAKSEGTNYHQLVVVMELLQYFLHNSSESFHQHSNNIIILTTPFLFLQSTHLDEKQHQILYGLANRILHDLNNTIDKERHDENLSTLHTCFFNKITSATLVIPGLDEADGEGVKPYIEMLIDNIVHGNEETFGQAVYLINILIKYTSPENLQLYILKIVGALIRVLNYQIKPVQKVQALQVIRSAHQKPLQLAQFATHLSVTYSKILSTINQQPDGLKNLAVNYAMLFESHPRKDLHLNELFTRALQSPTDEGRENHLKIIKTVLKYSDSVFSKALLERIFNLTRQLYERLNTNSKSQAYETRLMGDILASTHKYANQAARINLEEKHLARFESSPEALILYCCFFRRNYDASQAPKLYALMVSQLTSDNTIVVNQIVRLLHKLKEEGRAPFTELKSIEALIPVETVDQSLLLQESFQRLAR